MKITIGLLSLIASSYGYGATITLAPLFAAGVVPSSLPAYVAIGSYLGMNPLPTTASTLVGEFDTFASGSVTTKLNGNYTAIDGSFNAATIYLLVGNGVDKASSTLFAIVETTSSFPANVTLADNITINTQTNGFVSQDLLGSTSTNAITLVTVPEPSTLLLSAFGVLGLLRRKR